MVKSVITPNNSFLKILINDYKLKVPDNSDPPSRVFSIGPVFDKIKLEIIFSFRFLDDDVDDGDNRC